MPGRQFGVFGGDGKNTVNSQRRNSSPVWPRGSLFTGIIEQLGTLRALEITSAGGRVTIDAPSLAHSLNKSESIAVNGCCLTVVGLDDQSFSADLSAETIRKTSFGVEGALKIGARVNLEEPLSPVKELGGHFVLGHVDTTGRVTLLAPEATGSDSWSYGIEVPEDFACHLVPKGSITIDGISLTVARWNPRTRIVEIAVIPYTYEHTNIRDRQPGDAVNLEADILGKYVERYLEARNSVPVSNLTMARLLEEGF
jgi:riboflavin synthase